MFGCQSMCTSVIYLVPKGVQAAQRLKPVGLAKTCAPGTTSFCVSSGVLNDTLTSN